MSAKSVFKMGFLSMVAATGLFVASNGFAADAHTTSKFEGVKANTGTATHARSGNSDTLAWSDDFKIPETPAPHWQVVDSKGNVYLLNQLKIKDGKTESHDHTAVLCPRCREGADLVLVRRSVAWARRRSRSRS